MKVTTMLYTAGGLCAGATGIAIPSAIAKERKDKMIQMEREFNKKLNEYKKEIEVQFKEKEESIKELQRRTSSGNTQVQWILARENRKKECLENLMKESLQTNWLGDYAIPRYKLGNKLHWCVYKQD